MTNNAGQNSAAASRLSLRIGAALYNARQELGTTQTEVADEAGVTQSLISMIEKGHRNKKFDLDQLDTIARAVGKESLSELIADAEALDRAPEEIVANALKYANRPWGE